MSCTAQKDGEQHPGKKGISLTPEQFNMIKDSASKISTALESQDTGFRIALSQRCAARYINVFLYVLTAKSRAHKLFFNVCVPSFACQGIVP